jgi:hypothetical protein
MTARARIVCLAAAALGSTQVGWTVYHANGGIPVRWHQGSIGVEMDADGTTDVPGEAAFDAIRASMQTWNDAEECAHPALEDGGKVEGITPGQNTLPHNLVIWETSAEWKLYKHDTPAFKDAIAVTTLYFDPETGIARKFDVELSDDRFTFTVSDVPGLVDTDVRNTVTHELGHALGLDHSKDPSAAMYRSAPSGDLAKRHVGPDDIEGLCWLYQPVTPVDGVIDDVPVPDTETCCPWLVPEAEPPSDGGSCGAGTAGSAAWVAILLLAFLVAHRANPLRRRR